MRKFEQIDKAICAAIEDGTVTYGGLCLHPDVRPIAVSLAEESADRKSSWYSSGCERVIDRRIQALRKQGKIRQARRAVWEVV